MNLWDAIASQFGRLPRFWREACRGKLPSPLYQKQMIGRCGHHNGYYSGWEDRPLARDANVVVFLDPSRHRPEQIRTSPLAERALDKCEEAFRHSDWQGFGYWHAVYLHERDRLNRPTRLS